MQDHVTTIVSCPAPLGSGGLGQHLSQLVAECRSSGELLCYYETGTVADNLPGQSIHFRRLATLCRVPPLRFSRGWQTYLQSAAFDRAVARQLGTAGRLLCFAGSAKHSFRRARELGCRELQLESATVHVIHARRMYDRAMREYPLESDWLHPRLVARTLKEYEMADVIWVNSSYARDTFLQEGVPSAKLRRRSLAVHERFVARPPVPPHKGLDIVYVGSLGVTKGVPVLIDAFAGLKDPSARLMLIGGYGSRGMRRYLEAAIRQDSRISIAPGDPLPYLRRADLLVHPSYSDGFGLAPMEALACEVPVVVTEETGMKEYVREGVNGHVIPAGEPEPILAILEQLARSSKS